MAKPIDEVPDSATAGVITDGASADEDLQAIWAALAESGASAFVRAMLEQRQPMADRLLAAIDSEPTRRALKTLATLGMGLGSLPEESGSRILNALAQALQQADTAVQTAETDKMSLWMLLGLLKDPDIARALHYLAGFLKGLGAAFERP